MDHGTKYIKEQIKRQMVFWENQNKGHLEELATFKEMKYEEKQNFDHWKEGYYNGKSQGSEEIVRELKYLLNIIDIYYPVENKEETKDLSD